MAIVLLLALADDFTLAVLDSGRANRGTVLGCDFSGTVAKLGSAVSESQPDLELGAHVVGFTLGGVFDDAGAFAQYVCVPAAQVQRLNVTVGAGAGVEWDVPGVPGLALDTRALYTGASYADGANTLRVPGWTRLDLGVRYTTEWSGRLVTLRTRVDNVADRNYWASSGGYPGSGYLVVGAPRTFTLSASVDF